MSLGLLAVLIAGCSGSANGPGTTDPEASAPSSDSATSSANSAAPVRDTDWAVDVADAFSVTSDGAVMTVESEKHDGLHRDGVLYTTYDLATGQTLAGPLEVSPRPAYSCEGESVKLPDGRSAFLDAYRVNEEAQGVEPATTTLHLRALDTRTLDTVWESVADSAKGRSSYTCDPYASSLASNSALVGGGRHIVLDGLDPHPRGVLVDLTDGAVTPLPDELGDLVGPMGDLIMFRGERDTLRLIDPEGLEQVFKITPWEEGGDFSVDSFTAANDLLLGLEEPPRTTTSVVRAWSLRTGKQVWTRDVGSGWLTMDPESGLIIRGPRDDDTEPQMVSLDPLSGETVWGPVPAALCGVFGGEVIGHANDQLVVLDAASGEQLFYDPDRGCPEILPGIVITEDEAKPVVR